MAQMTKKEAIARFEKTQRAVGRPNSLSIGANGCYANAWMRERLQADIEAGKI